MSPTPLLIALLALAAHGGGERLSYRPAPGTVLVRTFTQASGQALHERTATINGRRMSNQLVDGVAMETEARSRLVVADRIHALAGGRPARLTRRFERLDKTDSRYSKGPEGEVRKEGTFTSPLLGREVVFEWSEVRGTYEAAWGEDERVREGDEALLSELSEDMDLRGFLPPQPVGPGTTWSVDPRVFNAVMEPGGDLALRNPQETDDPTRTKQARDLAANVTGEVEATWRETVEQAGTHLAVIDLRLSVRTFSEDDRAEDVLDGAVRRRLDVAFELTGELCWDLTHGHACSLELAGDGRTDFRRAERRDQEGQPLDLVQHMVFRGPASFGVQVARR